MIPQHDAQNLSPLHREQIILATDLAHGFEYVARFKASTTSKGGRRASIVPDMGRDGPMSPASGGSGGAGGCTPKGASGAKDPLQAQILLMQMVIKVRDTAVDSVNSRTSYSAYVWLGYTSVFVCRRE